MVKRLGVLTGGGDSSGINAALRTITRRSCDAGVELVGIRRGWGGLLEQDTEALTIERTEHILYTGGTILGTSRTNPFNIDGGQKKLEQALSSLSLDAMIAIGGDDTLTVANKVCETTGLPMVGIAQSIDNDIDGTEYCIGFDSAVSRVSEAVNNVRTTCLSHDQDIVIEVMGRETGWIAAASALATEAEFCLIPELHNDISQLAESLLIRRRQRRQPSVVLVAEGCPVDASSRIESNKTDAFGHPYLAGVAYSLRDALSDLTGLTIRALILGYIQRGGPPTSYEVQMAVRLGHEAVERALLGEGCKLIAVNGGEIVDTELASSAGRKRYVCGELLELVKKTWYPQGNKVGSHKC